MTRIYTTATIACPLAALYDYVTTPAYWPEWHPSSLGVSDGAEHSLLLGERVTERFLVAGRRGSVVWTVTEREEPQRWVIVGAIEGATAAVPSPTCSPSAPMASSSRASSSIQRPTRSLPSSMRSSCAAAYRRNRSKRRETSRRRWRRGIAQLSSMLRAVPVDACVIAIIVPPNLLYVAIGVEREARYLDGIGVACGDRQNHPHAIAQRSYSGQ